MIYLQKPEQFNPIMNVVGCFVEVDDTFLLLQRQSHKSEPNAWGLPSGKVDDTDNNLLEAMKRELFEETGIDIITSDLSFFETVYVKYEKHDIIYHMFSLKMKDAPTISLSEDEHIDYRWVTPDESYSMDLMIDKKPCIELRYNV